jgi:hypothetical protein
VDSQSRTRYDPLDTREDGMQQSDQLAQIIAGGEHGRRLLIRSWYNAMQAKDYGYADSLENQVLAQLPDEDRHIAALVMNEFTEAMQMTDFTPHSTPITTHVFTVPTAVGTTGE